MHTREYIYTHNTVEPLYGHQIGAERVSLLVRCPHFNGSKSGSILGVGKDVLLSELSSIQGLKCMQEWYLGWEMVSCLEFRGVLIERERFHTYTHTELMVYICSCPPAQNAHTFSPKLNFTTFLFWSTMYVIPSHAHPTISSPPDPCNYNSM